MDSGIFVAARWALALIVAVTILWPLNIPLVALAYRVRLGDAPFPLDRRPFWIRSTFAALGLCLMSLVLLGLNHLFVGRFLFPPGPIHLSLLLLYIPAGVGYLFWMYALEDMLQGLSLFVLYMLLPGIPLLVLNWLRVVQLVTRVSAWLQPMTS